MDAGPQEPRACRVELGPWQETSSSWREGPKRLLLTVAVGFVLGLSREIPAMDGASMTPFVVAGLAGLGVWLAWVTVAWPTVRGPRSIDREGVWIVERDTDPARDTPRLVRFGDIHAVRAAHGFYLFLDAVGRPLFHVHEIRADQAVEIAHAARFGIDGVGPTLELARTTPSWNTLGRIAAALASYAWVVVLMRGAPWIAWPALVIGLIAAVLLGVRSRRTPQTEFALRPPTSYREASPAA